jgi:predicted nucleic acid-binding protein
MTVVVDASVAVRWFITIEGSEHAEKMLGSGERLIAPDLVIAEIANAAWKAVNFGDATADGANEFVRNVARLFDELVPSATLKDRALAIALDLRHPVYDCFYLALAEQRDTQVVTADDRLLARCAPTPFARLVRSLITVP